MIQKTERFDSVPAVPAQSDAAPQPVNKKQRTTRRIITALLLFHLSAIVVGPWSVAPGSLLSLKCWNFFRPYLEATHLNHGYHFFAPEPGPSHLVRYELQLSDGSQVTGTFPDKTEHTPRLLYHRHFMLSEYLNTLALDENQQELFQAVTQSYANHLLEKHDAVSASLFLRRHYIPSPQDVIDGKPLTDLTFFAERPLGIFNRSRL